MKWIALLIQLVSALAAPAVTLVALYWFRDSIENVLDAIAFFIKERKFKTNFPGVSLEVGDEVRQEVQSVQNQIEAIPSPADMHAPVSDVVEARRFILRDDAGRVRAEIGLRGKKESRVPVIRLLDTSGKGRILLVANENDDASGILVEGSNASTILLAVSKDGPRLLQSDGKTGTRLTPQTLSVARGAVRLGATKDGSPYILLRDKQGEQVFGAP